MHTIIPAPTVTFRIKEMTPRQSNLAEESMKLLKDTASFIAFIVFVCGMIAVCLMIKT